MLIRGESLQQVQSLQTPMPWWQNLLPTVAALATKHFQVANALIASARPDVAHLLPQSLLLAALRWRLRCPALEAAVEVVQVRTRLHLWCCPLNDRDCPIPLLIQQLSVDAQIASARQALAMEARVVALQEEPKCAKLPQFLRLFATSTTHSKPLSWVHLEESISCCGSIRWISTQSAQLS